jgi:ribosomal protein L37E
MAANKSEMIKQTVHSCWRCGNNCLLQTRFCGSCGAGIRKKKYSNRLRSESLLKFKKKLLAVAIIGFIAAFLVTCIILFFKRSALSNDGPFLDIPVDHQVYADCKRLIELDGCRIRSPHQLEPAGKADVADVNQAMLAVIRYNKSELHQELLLSADKLNKKALRKYFGRIAEYFDRQQRLAHIEETRFNDLSRFNIWSMIEKIFLEKINAY